MNRKTLSMIVAVAIVSFLSNVDMTIINTSLPQISDELRIPMNQAEWISSTYLILICMTLILFGKLGDQLNKFTIFQIGTLIFTFSSLLCGFSSNLIILLIARGVQGIGASMTMATNMGIITENVPFSLHGRALGIQTMIGQAGYIAGPAVAGVILSIANWHWIFWFNVPIGIIAFIFGRLVSPKVNLTGNKHLNIDWNGFIVLALLTMTFFLSILVGQEIGFERPMILIGFGLTAILIMIFIQIEMKIEEPILDLNLFKNVGFSISVISLMITYIIIYSNNVLLPFYIQNTLKFTPGQMGLIMSILPIVNVIAAYVGGVLCDQHGAVHTSFWASFIFIFAEGIFAIVQPSWSLWILILGFITFGLANGLFQNNPMVMENANQNQQGVAGSILALGRTIGFTMGLSLSTSILYAGMSIKAHQKITTYPVGNDQLFVFGMHLTYWVAILLMISITIMLYWLLRIRNKNNIKGDLINDRR